MNTDSPSASPAPDDRTPFDASPAAAPGEAQEQSRRAAEQAALEAKMALLPDYGDEAFPRHPKKRSASKNRQAATNSSPRKIASEDADFVASPRSVVAGGCLGGVLGNMALGVALSALQRSGIGLHGPGVLAVVVAVIILALVAGSWPRKVWLATGGFLVGLVVSFGALFLLVRPLLSTALETRMSPVAEPAPPVPSDGPAS